MRVYLLTCKVTGKAYVGATNLSMPRRMGAHRQDAEKGKITLIAQAIREHGWDNFDVSVLSEHLTAEALFRAEADTIKVLNTLHPSGYNRSSCGSHGWTFTDDEKRKLSASMTGRKPWNTGLRTGPMPEHVKAKQRVAHLGQKAWNRGVPHTDEARIRMREAHTDIAHWNERPVVYQGVQYPSIVAARLASGLSKMQMRYKLMKGVAQYVTPQTEGE